HNEEQGKGAGSESEDHSGHLAEDYHDEISVFGIPKEDMTEPVRKALKLLLGEINALRGQLISAHGHEAYLEEQVEKDRLLQVMRRKAFMARLSLAVRRVEDEHVLFCVLYFCINNVDTVQSQYGSGAVENMMVHASDILREKCEAGDVIGSLDHFDFGIVLPGIDPVHAAQRGHNLVAEMAAHGFSWQGQRLHIQAKFGVTEIAPGDSGDDIIERAKQVMDSLSPQSPA
ncbi:MAG: hypothetical protein COB59_11760, partial [Rhodospirillaceae bacterium]